MEDILCLFTFRFLLEVELVVATAAGAATCAVFPEVRLPRTVLSTGGNGSNVIVSFGVGVPPSAQSTPQTLSAHS